MPNHQMYILNTDSHEGTKHTKLLLTGGIERVPLHRQSTCTHVSNIDHLSFD